jgi:hypothetical protein
LSVMMIFIVGECILLRMYQISKYKQPSFATVLQRALLFIHVYHDMFRLIQSTYGTIHVNPRVTL